MPVPFALEQQVAIAAVRRACALTTTVFNKLVAGETLVKGDKSPVTVADYSAQAVVNTILTNAFPNDPIVGEEDASDLRARPRNEEVEVLRARVVQLADDVLELPPLSLSSSSSSGTAAAVAGGVGIGLEEREEWGLGRRWGAEALLKAIDRGNHAGGRTGRFWTLDPIDGTKGFLRGGQYAVCLALLVDARVELGVIGCPNLPLHANTKGALFVAVRGHGAYQLPLFAPAPTPLSMPRLAPHELSFLESVESGHAALDTHARVAARLGVRAEPVRMDSQVKYAALVRGDGGGGVYMRLPVARHGSGGGGGGGYEEKIWDHAPGSLLVEEAGGVISDSRGRALDFGLGRTLGENFGVVAARKEVHAQVIDAVQAVLAAEG
ncbi:3(2),5-bisphosphate nucleotidase HAL2 [Russula dissimulans]|nr:3(2),5-bisphosphate nucleotidase HAL2 [Russula dissimulans]